MAKKTYIIGRAGDITLYDDTVSRKHACLEVDGNALFLKDLDSRNGTYEIRDNKLVPFNGGAVTIDQVFAFGECVRSVTQLLSEIDGSAGNLADTAGEPAAVAAPMDATMMGGAVAPRARLSTDDIIAMLEQVEDGIAAGGSQAMLCASLGIREQRYLRWCTEYGGATRAEREKSTHELRRENERLRKLVADLSLERDVLKEAIRNANERVPATPTLQSPNLTIVSDGKS